MIGTHPQGGAGSNPSAAAVSNEAPALQRS